MNTKVLAGGLVVIAFIGAVWYWQSTREQENGQVMEKEGMMEVAEKVETKSEVVEPAMESKEMQSDSQMMAQNGYIDYDASKLAFAEKGKVVLFFKADWCSTCIALDKNITENLSELPKDVLLMKVNYDTARDLKKQYNVLGQHTLVQVDSKGVMIASWRGSSTLAELVAEIQ